MGVARRNDIDWEAIERDYRSGQLTLVDVAKKHGVSDSQIRAKAKKNEWPRDLSVAIEQRTKEKISAIDISEIVEQSAKESAQKSAALIKSAIEQASDVAAGVVIKHRASIKMEMERAQSIEAILDEHMSSAESVRDINTIAQAYKTLVDAKAKLRDQERVVFNLDKGDSGSGDAAEEIRKAIAEYKAKKCPAA